LAGVSRRPPASALRVASRRVASHRASQGTFACHISHVLSFNLPHSSSIASLSRRRPPRVRARPRPRVPRSPTVPPRGPTRRLPRAASTRDSRLLLRRRSEARDPRERGITDHPKQPEHGDAAPPRGPSRVSHRRHRVHVRRRPLRARDDLFRDLSEHASRDVRARCDVDGARSCAASPRAREDMSRARMREREKKRGHSRSRRAFEARDE